MKLKAQKRLAASIEGVSQKRVRIDLKRLEELDISLDDFKQSITKDDIRSYIKKQVIEILPPRGISKVRARKRKVQRRKGRQKGPGTRKGGVKARLPKKESWINRIRPQRHLLNTLKQKKLINQRHFRELYQKAKGGFFRSRRHIKIYAADHGMIKND